MVRLFLLFIFLIFCHSWGLPRIGQGLSKKLNSSDDQECAPWECRGKILFISGVILPMEGLINRTDHAYQPHGQDEDQPLRQALFEQLIDPAVTLGLGMEFNYYQSIEMDLRFQYSRLNTLNSYGRPIPLHQAISEFGFAYLFWGRWQTGLSLHFVSARGELEEVMLLEDNESDFGHYFRWSSPRLKIAKTEWGLGLSQWSAWTKPNWTDFVGVEVQGAMRLW